MTKYNQRTERQENQGKLLNLLRNNEIYTFRKNFLNLHYYDQGKFYIELSDGDRKQLYHLLSPKEVSHFFETLDIPKDDYEDIFNKLDAGYAAEVIGNMQYDNAADIMSELPKSMRVSLVALMEKKDADQIHHLLNYEEDTAGGIMTSEFVSISSRMTVREAMRSLKEAAPDSETIYYVFVVDKEKELAGIISLRELIIADDDEYIEDIMRRRVVSVLISDDQEKAARVMRDYDLLALPVLDDQNHLMGIITADDIMDVINEEANEDYSKLAGMSDSEHHTDSSIEIAKKRLPWLIGLTFMGMITATMLTAFEDTLEQVAILGAFIPIIGGMAGNTGTQSLAVAVRGISTGKKQTFSVLKRSRLRRYHWLYLRVNTSWHYLYILPRTISRFDCQLQLNDRDDYRNTDRDTCSAYYEPVRH